MPAMSRWEIIFIIMMALAMFDILMLCVAIAYGMRQMHAKRKLKH